MPAKHHEPPTTYRIAPACRELTRAAVAALQAPSVLNTQPWHWRLTHDAALLYADPSRRLATMDPTGRLLVLSCGAALHHACVTLAADGVDFEVEPLPENGWPHTPHEPDVGAPPERGPGAPPGPGVGAPGEPGPRAPRETRESGLGAACGPGGGASREAGPRAPREADLAPGLDLLAVVHHRGPATPSPDAQRLRRAIPGRRSDRRPFAGTPVPDDAIERLRRAAERPGSRLHVAWARELTQIALAAGQAADAQLADPAYRTELAAWVRRPGEGHDGVPIDTLSPVGARPVPVRDFNAAEGVPGILSRVDVGDREARYGIVVTDGDGPRDWLIAGVTLSAVLLAAAAEGLATSTMSDVVENEVPRRTLRRMLGGVGYPAIGVRIGVPAGGAVPPKAPRRPAAEVIEVVADLLPAAHRP